MNTLLCFDEKANRIFAQANTAPLPGGVREIAKGEVPTLIRAGAIVDKTARQWNAEFRKQ